MSSNRSIAKGSFAAALICSIGCMGGGSWPLSSSTPTSATQQFAGQAGPNTSATDAPASALTKALWDNPLTRAVRGSSPDAVQVQHTPNVIPPTDPLSLSHPAKPPSAELYVSMGRMAERAGNAEKAAEFYRKALETAPNDADALLAYGHFNDRQGRLEQATKLYLAAVQASPQHARAHNDLGLCYARQGQLPNALQSVRRAVQLSPDRPIYRNNLAKVLVEMGRGKEAVHELARVLPQAQAHYNVGWFFAQAGKQQQAKTHFSSAIQLDPQMDDARAWLARLEQGGRAARRPAAATNRFARLPASATAVDTRVAGAPQAQRSTAVGGPSRPKPIITNVRAAGVADPQTDRVASLPNDRPGGASAGGTHPFAGRAQNWSQQPADWAQRPAGLYQQRVGSRVPDPSSAGQQQGSPYLDSASPAQPASGEASQFDGQSHDSPWGRIPSPYRGAANDSALQYPASLASATRSTSPPASHRPATIANPYAPYAGDPQRAVRQASAQTWQ